MKSVPRPPRIEYPGAHYHVMSRGVNRTCTFIDDHDRRYLLEKLGGIVALGALIVHAFCLMPNHYHLLCQKRRMLMFALETMTLLSNQEIAARVGVTPSAVSKAHPANRKRSVQDSELDKRLARLLEGIRPE